MRTINGRGWRIRETPGAGKSTFYGDSAFSPVAREMLVVPQPEGGTEVLAEMEPTDDPPSSAEARNAAVGMPLTSELFGNGILDDPCNP